VHPGDRIIGHLSKSPLGQRNGFQAFGDDGLDDFLGALDLSTNLGAVF
jgi:hypothetical protein